MTNQDEYNILRLIRSENVGSITFQKLLNFFGSCGEAINNIDLFKNRLPIKIANRDIIDKEIKETEKFGAKIITFKNENYPKELLKINDFPPVITIYGNINLLKGKIVAIIGSRNASMNGCIFTKKIAKDIGNNGYVVISGMATGIDTFAHWGSIETGTIAVLGGGINNIYPKDNEKLYKELQNKALIISEKPFNSAPIAESFPARNRIITALSFGIVVIEAGYKSGTINTVHKAIEQGKEVMVAPGNPYDPRNEGSNKLIKDGATVITDADDILYHLENITSDFLRNNKIVHETQTPKQTTKKNSTIEKKTNKNSLIDFFTKKKNKYKTDDLRELILSKLNNTPINIEILNEELNTDIETLNSLLTELELEGLIIVEFGKVRIN
jgi:DNA processing protein